MKIAILGWGSLVWDPRNLSYEGSWAESGPELPLEFSRVSGGERLTLVIDLNDGVMVPTRYVESTRKNMNEAIYDLRTREGSPARMIGYVDLLNSEQSNTQYPQHADVFAEISTWCNDAGFDAVVWTALPPNFHERTQKVFSVANAIKYLQGLSGQVQKDALEYIANAPAEVDTPVRREARRLGLI